MSNYNSYMYYYNRYSINYNRYRRKYNYFQICARAKLSIAWLKNNRPKIANYLKTIFSYSLLLM